MSRHDDLPVSTCTDVELWDPRLVYDARTGRALPRGFADAALEAWLEHLFGGVS